MRTTRCQGWLDLLDPVWSKLCSSPERLPASSADGISPLLYWEIVEYLVGRNKETAHNTTQHSTLNWICLWENWLVLPLPGLLEKLLPGEISSMLPSVPEQPSLHNCLQEHTQPQLEDSSYSMYMFSEQGHMYWFFWKKIFIYEPLTYKDFKKSLKKKKTWADCIHQLYDKFS